jgi:hypothetical protein
MNITSIQIGVAGAVSRQVSFNTGSAQKGTGAHCVSLLCACLLAIGGVSARAAADATADAAKGAKITAATATNDISGVYKLVTLDGKKVPTKLSHEGAALEIRSGSFTIKADGRCISKMTFVPPSGTEATMERTATYTREGGKLSMQWQGAGRTTGTVKGDTFTMDNEGMVFAFKK